ncbi:MAG TPA: VWA domain-containing protein [Bryobacteraceae bacterium]|nr:VWA domain-containing protein [Bryobacteraceae bacterium]
MKPLLFAACLCCLSWQPPSFSSRVEAVRVDVLVTDHGRPVTGLKAPDFEIVDNGVPQQIDLVSYEQIPLNVVLGFDMSDSVAGEKLDNLRKASAAVLGGLKAEDQAALVAFSHVLQLGSSLTHDVGTVKQALDDLGATGETALIDGAFASIMVGESDAGRSLLIMFSDGVDTASWLTADAVLNAAKRSDVVAYAVSVRSGAKPDFLRDLASFTGGRLFEIEKTANLEAAFLEILDEFRHRYLVSYTPRGVARDGWHKLDVKVRRGGTVKARPGYLAGS